MTCQTRDLTDAALEAHIDEQFAPQRQPTMQRTICEGPVMEIENVAMPTNRRGLPRKYPFSDLEVGQSFFAPMDREGSLSSLSSRYGRLLGRRFALRRMEKDGVKGVRVFRVEDPHPRLKAVG